jgi:hypothetical protein
MPVGVPLPGVLGPTVAVNVSDWPKSGDKTEADIVVVVGSRLNNVRSSSRSSVGQIARKIRDVLWCALVAFR